MGFHLIWTIMITKSLNNSVLDVFFAETGNNKQQKGAVVWAPKSLFVFYVHIRTPMCANVDTCVGCVKWQLPDIHLFELFGTGLGLSVKKILK